MKRRSFTSDSILYINHRNHCHRLHQIDSDWAPYIGGIATAGWIPQLELRRREERGSVYIYIYNEWKCCWWHPIYINMPVNRRIARRGEARWKILAGLCDREVWGVGCDWTKKRGKNSPGSLVSVCSYAVGRWPLCCNWNQLGWHSVS